MASISFLVCGTEYSLLLLVISGLSSLPAAWRQYCNTVNGTFIRIPVISRKKKNAITYLRACLGRELQRRRKERYWVPRHSLAISLTDTCQNSPSLKLELHVPSVSYAQKLFVVKS